MDLSSLRLRRTILYFTDILFCFSSLYLAFVLRIDGTVTPYHFKNYLTLLPFVFFCRSLSFFYFGFYTRFWEYSSLEDLIQIIKAVVVSSILVLFVIFFYNRAALLYRSILFMDMILLIVMLGGSRMAWRLFRERENTNQKPDNVGKTRVLILGAGYTGAHLLKHLRRFSSEYHVCGFIDKDAGKINSNIMDVKVLGSPKDISQLAQVYKIKQVLIAVNNISSEDLGEIVSICSQSGVKYKMTVSVVDLPSEEVHIAKIRNIEISDLLGRDPVSLDLTSISKMIRGKRILVTGAGGSIGSELCSQIIEYQPESLCMLERTENYLYELEAGLASESKLANTHYLLGSITSPEKVEDIFSRFKPQLVFHAAAHKHVPIMEKNADEAVINNVYGTKVVADTSEKYGVEKFILVSTDKVVKPSSIMGRTKKIAEHYIRFLSMQSKTQFITVRFGNVLGSNGSVVPLFKKQIEKGGPVSVTHPDMERYFMLIPEAAQLIIQAAVMGKGGEIFLLEMGKSVKIVELAKRMIRLAGLRPDEDIAITFSGIRKGEKLYEELIDSHETPQTTYHEKIKILASGTSVENNFDVKVQDLIDKVRDGNRAEVEKELTFMTSPAVSSSNNHVKLEN